MRSIWIIPFGVLALLAGSGGAQAIDCARPTVPAVVVVCSSPDLLKIIAEREHAYRRARSRVSGKERLALIADQRRWVASYPKTCGVPEKGALRKPIPQPMITCFEQAMTARVAYLRQYGLAKPASPLPAKASEAAKLQPASKSAAVPADRTLAVPSAPAEAAPPALPAIAPTPLPKSAPIPATPSPTVPAVLPPQTGLPNAEPASPAAAATYHLKFTFACENPKKLPRVLKSLAANNLTYPLSQADCLPVPSGHAAALLSISGKVAKIRLCGPHMGCIDTYADAASVLNAEGQPVAK